MKKGQKVRILRTNQIATIIEVELIRKGGKVHRYCHLKVDKKPDLWLDSSELGSVLEHCKITIQGENGQAIHVDFCQNYADDKLKIDITGCPENLKEHKGLHIAALSYLLLGCKAEPEE
ncbi:hypothetical protein [Bacteroides rodentium]